jgi:hypothetical protein
MADPEGFKAGSAWMDVKPRIDDAEWRAKISAAVEGASVGAGPQLGSGLSKGLRDAEAPIMDEAERIGKGLGTRIGDNAGIETAGRLRDSRGRFVAAGQDIGDDIGKGIGDGVGKGVDPGLTDFDKKIKDKTKATAKDAGNGMSPLLLGAFTAAAAFGPAAILAGTGIAVAGIGGLITKSNANVQAEYKTLAYDISHEMTDAVSPLVPAVQASMVQVDNSIRGLGPTLKTTFADAEPDLFAFTKGVTGLASSALPGINTALDQSRGIVSGFSGSLPTLGSGIGRFFTGLTTDAQSTQTGIVDFVDVASNALGTLGHVAGSASAVLSTDFAAVTPVLNGALTVIDKIASPTTVGGLIGAFGAMKFDPAISKGIQGVSNGFTSIAAKADGATGLLGKAGGAAETAAGGFGKMADVMGGPWGIAIGAGVGLLGGLVSSLGQAKVNASDFTAAVAQDNGVVGASTTAIIQNQVAKLQLTSVQKDLGVSQATLIEYAAGEKDAQDKVNAAYNAKQAALDKLVPSSERLGRAAGASQVATREESNELANAKSRLDQMTTAVQQALKDQNDQNQAFLAATKSAGIFAGMVDTATTALQTQAEQSSISTVAALQLGDGQQQLGQHLSNILYNYQLATAGAQGYGNTLQALFGTTSQLDDAQNTLDQDVLNAKTSFAQNKFSMDQSTQAGINNRTALSAASKAIVQLGVDQYQASGNMNQANQTINSQIDAFVKSTGATGKAKDAIVTYLDKITQIPADMSTTVKANVSQAQQAVAHLLNDINASYGTVQVYAVTHNLPGGGVDLTGGGKALGAGRAGGGPVTAGSMSKVGEHGEETVLFGQDGYVLTHGQTVARDSRPQASGPQIVNHFHYYGPQQPDPETKAAMLRDLAATLA